MIESIYKPDISEILSVEWTGDTIGYDEGLFALGEGHTQFLIVNPHLEDDADLVYYIREIPDTDACVVWFYEGQWIAKLFHNDWRPIMGYQEIELVKPKMVWQRNPDIDKLMTFSDDPFNDFEPGPWDRDYKLIWHMDPRFNPLEDKVWTVCCTPVGREIKGTKDMGYMTPDVVVEFNEYLPDLGVNIDECCPPFWELTNECAYELDPKHQTDDMPEKRMWVVKFTPAYKKPREWKWMGIVSPQFDIEYNPDLPQLNYELDYVIPWHDFTYEHVWMLDDRHLKNGEDDIWAIKVRVTRDIEGSKIVDYIRPQATIEYNPDLPQLEYKIDYIVPWHDLGFEQMWLLDRQHIMNGEEDIWVVKVRYTDDVEGTTIVGQITPKVFIEYNPALPKLEYSLEHVMAWYDLGYEHVWMLDRKHLQNGEEDMWAIKAKCLHRPKGTKIVDYVAPIVRFEYNSSLPKMNYNINYVIPWHDLEYKHVWYLDPAHSNGENVWAAKVQGSPTASGEKVMGNIVPLLTELDVIFISYGEPNAEANWQRVLEKASWAKRVDGVKGIFDAHKAAARLAETDMFYVVDGDAYLTDDWEFNYQPSIYDRDCTFVWSSKNPVNGLIYGYGGVKIFPKKDLLKQKTWTSLDMSTTVVPKLKVLEEVSNITAFNTSKIATWRSAFREAVKLYVNTIKEPDNKEHQQRLDIWSSIGNEQSYGNYAIEGALDGIEFAKKNINKFDLLKKINDREWLDSRFKIKG